MEDFKAFSPPPLRPLRSQTKKCRVCLKKSNELVNIFDISQDQGVSIAKLLSQSTGLEISKGDSNPETVCSPCLQDAKNAFEIKKSHQTSHQFFQQLKQDPAPMIDFTKEASGLQVKMESNENFLEESAPQMEYFLIDEFLSEEVKLEPVEDLISIKSVKKESTEEYDQVLVINEPIEDDSLEEDVGKNSDYDIDPSYLQKQNTIVFGNRPISEFQCSFCPRLFPTKSQQKIHEHRHKGPTYKCPHCQMAFIFQSLLKEHIRKCQKKIPLLKCIHCELSFKSQIELEKHIETHTKKLYRCSVESCQRVFHNNNALKNHIAFNHLKKSSTKCSHCQTDFPSTRELIEHIKITHTEDDAQVKTLLEQRFMCSYCDKSYQSNQGLVTHVKNKHHCKEKSSIKCSHCQTDFPSTRELIEHIKITHMKDDAQVKTLPEQRFMCSYCDRSYKSNQTLALHLKTKHWVFSFFTSKTRWTRYSRASRQ